MKPCCSKKLEGCCNCCDNELQSADADNAKKIAWNCVKPKHRICSSCKEKVCKSCGKDQLCHECVIRLNVPLEPRELMQLERRVLIEYLIALHYEKGRLEAINTPHLVKLLLARFNVHKEWDPDLAESEESKLAETPAASKQKSQSPVLRLIEIKSEVYFDGLKLKDLKRILRENSVDYSTFHEFYEFKQAVLKLWYSNKLERPSEFINKDAKATRVIIPLQSITSKDYFDRLTIDDYKQILQQHSINFSNFLELYEYKQAVIKLWKITQKKNKAVEKVTNQQDFNRGIKDVNSTPERQRYSTPKLTIEENAAIKVPSLLDIKSLAEIETMERRQLKRILQKHKKAVHSDQQKSHLVYEVKLLWLQATRENSQLHLAKVEDGHKTTINVRINVPYNNQPFYNGLPIAEPPPSASRINPVINNHTHKSAEGLDSKHNNSAFDPSRAQWSYNAPTSNTSSSSFSISQPSLQPVMGGYLPQNSTAIRRTFSEMPAVVVHPTRADAHFRQPVQPLPIMQLYPAQFSKPLVTLDELRTVQEITFLTSKEMQSLLEHHNVTVDWSKPVSKRDLEDLVTQLWKEKQTMAEYAVPNKKKTTDNIKASTVASSGSLSMDDHRQMTINAPLQRIPEVKEQPAMTKTPPQNVTHRRVQSFGTINNVLFRDVHCARDIEEMSEGKLGEILAKNSIEVNETWDKAYLISRVTRIWEQRRVQAAQKNPPGEPPKSISLTDITSDKEIENFSSTQLKAILRDSGKNADNYTERYELLWEVRLLWDKARLERNMGDLNGMQRNPEEVPNVIELLDIASESEIEQLSTPHLRSILRRYGRPPEGNGDRPELVQSVRLLWYKAQKEKIEGKTIVDTVAPKETATRKRSTSETKRAWLMSDTDSTSSLKEPSGKNIIEPRKSWTETHEGIHQTPIKLKAEIATVDHSGSHGMVQVQVVRKKTVLTRQTSTKEIISDDEIPFVPSGDDDGRVPEVRNMAIEAGVKDQTENEEFLPSIQQQPVTLQETRIQEVDLDLAVEKKEQEGQTIRDKEDGEKVSGLLYNGDMKAISLADIHAAADIENMPVREMKTLLRKYSVTSVPGMARGHLIELITQLWNKRREKGNEQSKNGQWSGATATDTITMIMVDNTNPHDSGRRSSTGYVPAGSYIDGSSGEVVDVQDLARTVEWHHSSHEEELPVIGQGTIVVEGFQRTQIIRETRTETSTDEWIDLSKVQSLSDIPDAECIPRLSNQQIKTILSKNAVDCSNCTEKSDLIRRLQQLWTDEQKSRGSKTEEDSNASKSEICCICLSRNANCVLLECGHVVTCIECGEKIKECPFCQTYIVRIVRIFKS